MTMEILEWDWDYHSLLYAGERRRLDGNGGRQMEKEKARNVE